MKEEFAKRLTLIRKEKGLSQKEAAQALGLSQALLSHYEKGIRECGLDFVARACTYYGVSADYLLGLSQLRSGEKLSEDLPDPSGDRSPGRGDLALGLGRRITLNGIDLLYELAGEVGSRAYTHALNNSLYLNVYQAFRLLHSANPQNEKALFLIDEKNLPYFAEAARLEQLAAQNRALAAQKSTPAIGQISLEERFPGRAAGLLNLIKNAETVIKR